MKSYYQQKKGGWTLEPVIYAKTVKQIRCYRFFRRILDEGGETGGEEAGLEVARKADGAPAQGLSSQPDLATARRYVEAVDLGLKRYVPEVYRKAVFAHVVDGVEYTDLEETSFASASTLKRYAQVFVWGVAEELGEIFPKNTDIGTGS